MAKLSMIAPAPVIDLGRRVVLDAKFADGIEAHAANWDGALDCILWQGAQSMAFPVEVDRASLPRRPHAVPGAVSCPLT